MRVLFVCTGNTGRSVMAENLMKAQIASHEDPFVHSIEVVSAGIKAHEGEEAEAYAVEVLNERGIEMGQHSARQVSSNLINTSDLILTMEEVQKNTLLENYGASSEKTHLLTEFVGDDGNVADCWGKEKDVYSDCADQITKLVESVIDRIWATKKSYSR